MDTSTKVNYSNKSSRWPIAALFAANGISMTGNTMAFVAIPWFVLQTTHSAGQTGVTGFFAALAAVVAAFLGGAVVDGLGFRPTSIAADLLSAVAFALIPLLYATVGLPIWALLGLVFVGNLLDAPGTTAREALVPELAKLAGMPLERASAGIQVVERGSRLIGAPLAGVLIAFVGASNVLWVDALTFVVSAILVALAIPSIKIERKQERGRYLDEFKAGIDFILHERLILAIVAVVMVTNFLDAPLGGVIYPVYAQKFLGNAVDLGLIIAASGGGAVVGALLFAAAGPTLPRRAIFFGGFAIVALHFWVFAAMPPLWVIVVVQFVSGLAAGPLNPIINTISYERIPAELRGRVFGAVTSGAYIAIPLGVLLAGYALEWVDIRLVLVMLGACYLATTTAGYLSSATAAMDERQPAYETVIDD